MQKTPKPLAPHSPRIAKFRYEANVCGPRNERGGRKVIATGRFTSQEAAQAWADAEHADSEYVRVTFYSARRNWQPQASGQRKNGEWS